MHVLSISNPMQAYSSQMDLHSLTIVLFVSMLLVEN